MGGMASGMGMMPQAFGFGGLGTLGLMDFLGGGEDLMEDQNLDDLQADEQLSSSKARLEKYGLAGPPSPMFDYGYGPVQQGRPPMPAPFFGPQTPGFWQQPQFGPAPPVQQPEALIQVDESVQQPEATQ